MVDIQHTEYVEHVDHLDGFLVHQLKSFSYAFDGIRYSFVKGTHFKIHIAASILVTVLGIIYSISKTEWLVIILIASAVIASEAINTAIEETCDVLHPQHHPGARIAKHCAAGGVLVLSVAAIIISFLIFIPHIFS